MDRSISGRGNGGRGRGRGDGGAGRGGGGYYQQSRYQEAGATRGRGGGGRGRGHRYPAQHESGGRGTGGVWGQEGGSNVPGRGRSYREVRANTLAPSGGRAWIPAPSSFDQPEQIQMQRLQISEVKPPLVSTSSQDKRHPIARPDKGGTHAVRSLDLLVNHFIVKFDPQTVIFHYDVDIKLKAEPGSRFPRKIRKDEMRVIREKLFSDDPVHFPKLMTAYDSEKNIFSKVPLPAGQFKVEFSPGEDVKSRSYTFTIKKVNELKMSKLVDYLNGELPIIPREIIQGMDLVMKENPATHRISVGKSFYSREFKHEDDLCFGLAVHKGFQQSLKVTSQGLALCLDYSILAFRKRLPVIDFLMEFFNFRNVNDLRNLQRGELINALKGLKVNVTHRTTKQKYTIAGLTDQDTRSVSFPLEDPEGKSPARSIQIVDYFGEKYGKEIKYKDIPCLNLGKTNKINYVPMEFCVLVEGQVFPKENMDEEMAKILKHKSLAPPVQRKNTICEMLQAEDGPYGSVAQNFDIGLDYSMTKVMGRVLKPPELKVRSSNGNATVIKVDVRNCQWNLVGNSVVDGKPIESWALIDFSSSERNQQVRLRPDLFINSMINRCKRLGILVKNPIVIRFARMDDLSSVDRVDRILRSVIEEARTSLQIIICVMSRKDEGYKCLKWVSETQIGILTQCCLSRQANKANDQTLANLALKINAKLGGSNFELIERLPCFNSEDHFMFIGADVNHPGALNSTCPSIAAVVATINWPAANRYAARVCPQAHRKEEIVKFGGMCLDLVKIYASINKVRPKRILIFRDGVSEGQFDKVLNEELNDLKKAFAEVHYQPTITLTVAQKRHQTRLFLQNGKDGVGSGNVPPGTVVDTKVVHPFENDFYLCSHHGILGTSKPTHYHVLWDEHGFTSDQLQKLIYDLCFTFVRCTKPVSLVPPVYYADLVAYRGRIFQEAMTMNSSPRAKASCSYSSASCSYSSASCSYSSASLSSPNPCFRDEFYMVQPQLQDVMFFV